MLCSIITYKLEFYEAKRFNPTARCTDVQRPDTRMSNSQVQRRPTAQWPSAWVRNNQVHRCPMANGQGRGRPETRCTDVRQPGAQCR